MSRHQRGWRVALAWALSALVWTADPASAQVFTGRIDVTVQDGTGALLPGVTVDVSGPQNQSTLTDTHGEAHVLNLPPGSYQVKASLSGFADFLNRAVAVTAGGAVPLRVTLGVQGVAEQVQVSGESPSQARTHRTGRLDCSTRARTFRAAPFRRISLKRSAASAARAIA